MKSILIRAISFVLVISQVAFGQSLDPRIQRVESGLRPAVLIKGEPGWTIQERMKFYKAPGVSVAVIQDFKIQWAKGYGLKDTETNEPVTVDTLLSSRLHQQAGRCYGRSEESRAGKDRTGCGYQ
jgi:Beta-lactamase